MNLYETRKTLSTGISIYDLKLRVVYYARVSTDKDEQLNSLVNQKSYFEEYIANNVNWTYIDSYIDEGISGLSINNRVSFLKMIDDAKNNKFDLILTKEISRFSRNTIDSLKYTTKLLTYGVAVYFLSDNINTINADSELRLAIMSSIAQEEVRKLSERVKFGLKRSMAKGNVLGGNNHTGYLKEKGKLKIDENKRKIIELLFSLYATNKYGFEKISDILYQKGYTNRIGKRFNGNVLARMLTNPKYKGYYCGNKSYIEDYKTSKKRALKFSDWIIYKDKNIPAIVSEELWDLANNIYKGRQKKYQKDRNSNIITRYDYVYTGIIKCKEHNSIYIRCGSGNRKHNTVWCCNKYVRHGKKGCAGLKLNEVKLNQLVINLIESECLDKNYIIKDMLNKYEILLNNNDIKDELTLKNFKLKKLAIEKRQLLTLLTEKIIDKLEFYERNNELKKEITIIKKDIKKLLIKINKKDIINNHLNTIKDNLKSNVKISNYLKRYVNIFIDKIIVDSKNNKLEIIYQGSESKIIEYIF